MSQYLGNVSAYAYAVEKGYTGTEEEFAELMASYATVGQTAVTAAQTATTKASEAATSATTATNKATEATTAATTATTKAGEAQTSAQTASTKASEASQSASTASTKASQASQSASQALTYKTAAESAKTASQTAQGLAETAQTAAETAQGLAEDARDEAQQYAESIDPEHIYSAYPTDTAEGSIASFADGADDIPLKSLIVDINPVQDLHGQESPYPAGGGKNLYDKDNPTRTNNAYVNDLGEEVSNNEWFITDYIPVTGTTFTVSNVSGYVPAICLYDSNKNFLRGVAYNTTSASVLTNVTIVSDTEASYARFSVNVSRDTSIIQLEAGSTATSYAPYENLCPINGLSEVNVEHTGKNLLKVTATTQTVNGTTFTVNDDGSVTVSGRPTNLINGQYVLGAVALPAGTYKFNGCSNPNDNLRLSCYNVTSSTVIASIYNSNEFEFTLAKKSVIRLFMFVNTTFAGTAVIRPMVRLSSITDATYEPYNGQTIPIDWQTEAGTVYGGKLDVLSGVLTVYPEYDSYNGETLTGRWISDRDVYAVGTTPTIGAQVVNIGAEGTEIQLSPHEVKSLLGQNNIFADTGDTEVEYRADTKMYIERLAEPDADMIADANITSGSYFMVGNTLYKATANIASGSAVIEGTNCTRKSLSEALNEINQ